MKKLLPIITAAALLTILAGMAYGAGQQVLRMSANDPQVQLAQDTAAKLDSGAAPDEVLPVNAKVDMARSLAPFVIIYDKKGHVIAGNGYLNDDVPVVPIGVLTHSTPEKDNAVTWQPQSGVRIASVSVMSHSYYVLSGRSLSEVEKRTERLGLMCFAGWLLLMAVLGGYYLVSSSSKR